MGNCRCRAPGTSRARSDGTWTPTPSYWSWLSQLHLSAGGQPMLSSLSVSPGAHASGFATVER